MPFEKGARIEIENQSDRNIDAFYFYVDYLEMAKLPKDMGRFHAWYNHNLTEALPEGETEWGVTGAQKPNTTGERNYVFMETQGKGHFVGINYYVHCPTPMWYGEGDDMWFIDGEKVPSIIRKSKFPQNPKRSVRFSGKRTKRSVQKRKARNTQKAETKVL